MLPVGEHCRFLEYRTCRNIWKNNESVEKTLQTLFEVTAILKFSGDYNLSTRGYKEKKGSSYKRGIFVVVRNLENRCCF